jgi:Tol biopolymer transport system component
VLWAAPFDPRSLRVTGPEVELPDTAASSANFFPDMMIAIDGTLLYRKASISRYEAVWVDRAGAATPVSSDLRDFALDGPMLSPDGRRIAVTMSGQDVVGHLWVQDLEGHSRTQVTSDGLINVRGRWRPGTNRITFSSDRSSPDALFLHEASADGSGTSSRPRVGDARKVGSHAWSPDGTWLLLRTDDQESGNGDIMGIRPGIDTAARALIATPAEELSPEVSPDGRWIAYTSNETGTRQVYVRPFPETSREPVQVSTRGGVSPAWSRSGRELFYIDGDQNLVSVPVNAAGSIQFGQSRVLFPADRFLSNAFGRQYDVHPDGQRFVMLRGESDAETHIVVVFNFAEDLKRRFAQRTSR